MWLEHWDVLFLFVANMTQWRTGARGPIGLDYNIFHHELNRKKADEKTFDQMMQDLRTIETQALVNIYKDA